MACSIQRGRGQLPMPITAIGGIAAAGAGGGSEAGMVMATGARPTGATRPGGAAARAAARSLSAPLQTRKLRSRPARTNETSSLPVIRHQAGKSSSTEISVERNSSSWPRSIGSMCWRISSRSPLPQSSSPPSKLTSAAKGCRSTGSMARPLVADAGTPVGEKLHELGPAHHGGAGHQRVLVELALLEARRAHVDGPARLGEVLHQLLEGREALLANVVGKTLLGE